jgi:hypothetical protein
MFAKRSLKKSTVPLAVGLALGMALPVSASALTLPSPYMVSAGPLGQIGVQGVVSGLGFYQDNPQGTVAGTLASKHVGADISNGLVIVQKSSGLVQFTLEAGAYSFPTLASGFTSASQTINDFGALPVAYVTLAPSKAFSVEIGKLPTLIGAEDGFTFQNLNIERGLLWDVEPIVSRGVQANYSMGPLSASLSWNDGYYSNRYNTVSGDLTWTIDGSNSLEFYASGNLGKAGGSTNNTYGAANIADGADDSTIYGLIYTYNHGPLTIEPYLQYMRTPAQPGIDLNHGFSNYGGAVLASYSFTPTFSLTGRVEYLGVSGHPGLGQESYASGVTDLPEDSHAWSVTLTPTYQAGDFFLRGELSYVTASCPTGLGFSGATGQGTTQLRGLIETGFLL